MLFPDASDLLRYYEAKMKDWKIFCIVYLFSIIIIIVIIIITDKAFLAPY